MCSWVFVCKTGKSSGVPTTSWYVGPVHHRKSYPFLISVFQLHTLGLKIIYLPSVRLTAACKQQQALRETKLKVYCVEVKAYHLDSGMWHVMRIWTRALHMTAR